MIGSEQFIVLIGTIVGTLATDLLIRVGIALEVAFNLGTSARSSGYSGRSGGVEEVPEGDNLVVLVVHRSAVFSNWLGMQATIMLAAALLTLAPGLVHK